MSHGLPVLTFDNVGPGELVGIDELTVKYQDYAKSTEGFASKLFTLFQDVQELSRLKKLVKEKHSSNLTWTAKGDIIRKELNKLINK